MATKKQTRSEKLDHVSSRLCALRSVIALCGFAAEARRTLTDIDQLKSINPDFEKSASRWIEAASEWATHDDTLGLVLKDAEHQIGKLQNLIDCVES